MGVLLYRLLTGRKPIGAVKWPGQMGLNPAWDPLPRKCLEPEADDRWANARELSTVLQSFGKPAARRNKKRLVLAALAMFAVALVALAVIAALTGRTSKQHGGTGVSPVISPTTSSSPKPTRETPVPPPPQPTASPQLLTRQPTESPAPTPTTMPTPASALWPAPTPTEEGNYTETADGMNLEMIWIPAGAFTMGSSESENGGAVGIRLPGGGGGGILLRRFGFAAGRPCMV